MAAAGLKLNPGTATAETAEPELQPQRPQSPNGNRRDAEAQRRHSHPDRERCLGVLDACEFERPSSPRIPRLLSDVCRSLRLCVSAVQSVPDAATETLRAATKISHSATNWI